MVYRNLYPLKLSRLHFLMLQEKLSIVHRSQAQSNRFATGVEKVTTGDSKLNDIPADSVP